MAATAVLNNTSHSIWRNVIRSIKLSLNTAEMIRSAFMHDALIFDIWFPWQLHTFEQHIVYCLPPVRTHTEIFDCWTVSRCYQYQACNVIMTLYGVFCVFCLFLSVSLFVFFFLHVYVLCVCLLTSVVWNTINEWMNECNTHKASYVNLKQSCIHDGDKITNFSVH